MVDWQNRPVRHWPDDLKNSLMICGSANATDDMLSFARTCAMRVARIQGWQIVVGDAYGIDATVVAACEQFQLRYICVGINRNPRNSAPTRCYQRFDCRLSNKAEQYAAVNRYMVDMATEIICISNGQDSDVLAVHQYARQRGCQVNFRQYNC